MQLKVAISRESVARFVKAMRIIAESKSSLEYLCRIEYSCFGAFIVLLKFGLPSLIRQLNSAFVVSTTDGREMTSFVFECSGGL